MKIGTIIVAALLILAIVPIVNAERTLEETYMQRLVSAIGYSNGRLRNFCTENKQIARAYEKKVCKDGQCKEFLAERWQSYCSQTVSDGGIKRYDYQGLFDEMRQYMKEHNLPRLKSRHETTTTIVEETTTTTTVDPTPEIIVSIQKPRIKPLRR